MSGFEGMVSLRPAQALPTDTNASLGEVAGATFAETLASNPSTAYYREKYLENAYAMSPDTIDAPSARQRLKSEGMEGRLQVPDQGIPRYALDTLIDRKREEMKRQDILSRAPSGIASNSVRLAVGMGGSLLDPLNVAAGFFPVVGEARYAQLLARAPLGIIGRTAVRAGVGAVEGTVGAAAIEPIVASSKHADQADYSMADSISNIAFGGVFGAGLHTMGGALGDLGRTIRGGAADIAANVDPATRAQALKTAVAQAASGQPVNVEPLVRLDPRANEGLFPQSDLATVDVPDGVRTSLTSMYRQAAEVKPVFDRAVHEISDAIGTPHEPLVPEKLKGVERAAEKTIGDYGGDATHLKDIVRATIVVDNLDQANQAVGLIRERFGDLRKYRNLLSNDATSTDGYRDINTNVVVNGHVAELQINLPEMLKAKDEMHPLYEERRVLADKIKLSDHPDASELARINELNARMSERYAAAWDEALSRMKASSVSGSPSATARESLKGLPSGTSKARTTAPPLPSGSAATGAPSTVQYTGSLPRTGRDIVSSSSDSIPPRVDMTDVRKAAEKQPLSILADERASKAADVALAQPVVDDITRVQQDLADELTRLKEAGIDTTEALAPYDQAIADAKTYAKAARAAVLCGLGHAA